LNGRSDNADVITLMCIPLILLLILALLPDCTAIAIDEVDSASITKVAVAVLKRDQITHPNFDLDFCSNWISKYTEVLDPSKLYFLQDDISEFQTYAPKLKGMLASKDGAFFELVSKRHEMRIRTALNAAVKRVDQHFDYEIDENIPLRYEKWPDTLVERTERWRLQIKYDLLVERFHTTKTTDPSEFVKSRYTAILLQFQGLTGQQKLSRDLNALCQAADPHSAYITQRRFNSFFGGTLGRQSLKSIGLIWHIKNGRAIVVGFAARFKKLENSRSLLGKEIVAIRSKNGKKTHHLREMDLATIYSIASRKFGKDDTVTLEVYDALTSERYTVPWPRLPILY